MESPNSRKRKHDTTPVKGIHKPFRSPLKQNNAAINQTPTHQHQQAGKLRASIPPLLTKSKGKASSPATLKVTALKATAPKATAPEAAAPCIPEATALYTPSCAAHTHSVPKANLTTTAAKTVRWATAPMPLSPPLKAQQLSTIQPTLQLNQLKKDIDMLQQSLRILKPTATPNTSSNIEEQTKHYRRVARNCLEDLYTTARDKVDSRGGLVGWKAEERERAESVRRWKEEEADARDSAGQAEDQIEQEGENEDMGEAERALRREEVEEAKEAKAMQLKEKVRVAKEEALEEEDTDGGGEDEGFTIGTMLKGMGIDASAVGWDVREGSWVD